MVHLGLRPSGAPCGRGHPGPLASGGGVPASLQDGDPRRRERPVQSRSAVRSPHREDGLGEGCRSSRNLRKD
ncbi:hypothetical protein QTO34_014975 [Cnephaeus nilssonii]|uniref:Uncharacterized protein n=1 Tax=Cnephaeus nilssonii TaxID=3371016 RepID=A0AA40HAH8_CNENI|nr:hypothetical protein QTO34_014975 [Eptesicus nilssonii]